MSISRRLGSIVTICVMVMAGVVAHGQELVDDPYYLSWARCKPGTTVTRTDTHAGNGTQTKREVTQKLLEVTATGVVLEVTMRGDAHPGTHRTRIAARATRERADLLPMPPDGNGERRLLADEDVVILGKSYRCKVIQWSAVSQGFTLSLKVWCCTEMPGQRVKEEMKISGAMDGGGIEETTTTTVTALDVK